MKFIKALQYAKERNILLPDDFYSLATLYEKKRAFTVSGVNGIQQIEYIKDKIEKAVEKGETFKKFKDAILNGDEKIVLPNGRLETIFRTNIQTAHNSQKYNSQLMSKNDRPFLLYRAIMDGRTRDTHAQLNGTIFDLRTQKEAIKNIYPPLGFNCRCTMVSLTKEDALEQLDNKKQIEAKKIIEDFTRKGILDIHYGFMPEEITAFYKDKVGNSILSLKEKKELFDKYLESMQAIDTLIDTSFLSDTIMTFIVKSFNQKTLKNRLKVATINETETINALTRNEAIALSAHIDDPKRLNSFLDTATAKWDLPASAHVAIIDSIFNVRKENIVYSKMKDTLFFNVNKMKNYKVGDSVFLKGYPIAIKNGDKNSTFMLKDVKNGIMFISEKSLTNDFTAVIAYGQTIEIKNILTDQTINNFFYKKIYEIEFVKPYKKTNKKQFDIILKLGQTFIKKAGGINNG